MTWAFPMAWWLLALAPVLILLHLRRNNPHLVRVSSICFWEKAVRLQQPRQFLGRVRQLLLLLLQLLILFLLVIAATGPKTKYIEEPLVLVLDNRPRMLAVDSEGESAWNRAHRRARMLLESASPSRPVAVVVPGNSPHTVLPFSNRLAQLAGEFGRLQPEAIQGDLGGAIVLAQRLLSEKGGGRIVVFTDREQDIPHSRDLPEAITLDSVFVGFPGSNLAIVSAGAKRSTENPKELLWAVSLGNFSSEESSAVLELSANSQLLHRRGILLPPGETVVREYRSVPVPLQETEISLHLKDRAGDQLAEDNHRTLLLPPATTSRALLITRYGSWFLEKLLHSLPGWELEILTPDQWTPTLGENFDLNIVEGTTPPGMDEQWLSRHAVWFLGVGPGGSGLPMEFPMITRMREQHQALPSLMLDRIQIHSANEILPPSGLQNWSITPLLEGPEGPLFLAGESLQASGRWLALAFPPGESDLPLQLAFPVLFQSGIEWLTRTLFSSGLQTDGWKSGESDLRNSLSIQQNLELPAFSEQDLLKWLLLAALLLLVAEWVLFRKQLIWVKRWKSTQP